MKECIWLRMYSKKPKSVIELHNGAAHMRQASAQSPGSKMLCISANHKYVKLVCFKYNIYKGTEIEARRPASSLRSSFLQRDLGNFPVKNRVLLPNCQEIFQQALRQQNQTFLTKTVWTFFCCFCGDQTRYLKTKHDL